MHAFAWRLLENSRQSMSYTAVGAKKPPFIAQGAMPGGSRCNSRAADLWRRALPRRRGAPLRMPALPEMRLGQVSHENLKSRVGGSYLSIMAIPW